MPEINEEKIEVEEMSGAEIERAEQNANTNEEVEGFAPRDS